MRTGKECDCARNVETRRAISPQSTEEKKCGCVEIGTPGKIPKYCPKHLKEHLDPPTPQEQEGWEKEFDNWFIAEYGKWKIGRIEAKNFIKNLLSARNKEVLEMVEKMMPDKNTTVSINIGRGDIPKEPENLVALGYGHAIQALKAQLNQKEI